jgi:CRP-like cAMP-binding protein
LFFFSFLQETFINEVFLRFEYITFTPGEVIINYSDPADRLVILVSGKVHVEFEHSEFHRRPMQMGAGQFFGDMAILGEQDWADSTCFNLMPQNTKEHTEILVFFSLSWKMASRSAPRGCNTKHAPRCFNTKHRA